VVYTIQTLRCLAQLHVGALQRGREGASSGSLDTLQLCQSDHALNNDGKRAMHVAAHSGHVHICKQLREAGCAWDTVACSRAVSACQLDTLRWLHENGCPWIFRSLCQDAARQGSIDIMAYMQQQSVGADWNANLLIRMLNCAGVCSKLAAAQWLRQQGAQWPSRLRAHDPNDIVLWSGEVLQWARAEGCNAPV
jgi:hypothetical protein